MPATAIVVPLRSFALGKGRLADSLDDNERAAIALDMASAVVAAAGARRVLIVTSAPEVAAWADTLELDRIDDPGTLDAAAAAGRAWAYAHDFDRYVVAHADLPLATSFDAVAADGARRVAVVVPDRHNDGTPVLSLPSDIEFLFAYGPGSAARHIAEAERLDLEVRVVHDDELGFDVDTAADLIDLTTRRRTPTR